MAGEKRLNHDYSIRRFVLKSEINNLKSETPYSGCEITRLRRRAPLL
jgi:hypothetical protein